MIAILMALIAQTSEPIDVEEAVFLEFPPLSAFAPRTGSFPQSARFVVECTVGEDGWVQGCRSIESTHRQFNRDIVRAAGRIRLAPATRLGAATEGRQIRIPVEWGPAE